MNILRLSLCVALLLALLQCAATSPGASDKTSVEASDPNDSKGDPCECRCPGGECCGEEESAAGRKKREEGTTSTAVGPKDAELVAQPGYVVPAKKRKPCFGRRAQFTEDCGPGRRAYKTRNFVMQPPPAAVETV